LGKGAELTGKIKIGNIRYVYMLSNVTGDVIALLVYSALNRFFPAPGAQVQEAVHDTKVESGEGERGSEEDVGGEKLEREADKEQ
jgi:NCS1 family nucleobase:cation symporter-1